MKKNIQKIKRQIRVRNKLQGTNIRPRMTVFRSNKFLYVQFVDDVKGKTILGVSEKSVDTKAVKTKIEKAKALGVFAAAKAKEKKITTGVFDRGSYSYHGRVKALAEGLREGGMKF
ncbi:MAG TPA: 50S ribosomal protein L18 [Candidatus Saccharimonadales bacterium]|nr:50S ribosomal protein L18 [Candidatus Saccharimonadales bacterium]